MCPAPWLICESGRTFVSCSFTLRTFCWSDPNGDKVLGTSAFEVACLWQILPTVTLPTYVVVKKKIQCCFRCIFLLFDFLGQSSKANCLILKRSDIYRV